MLTTAANKLDCSVRVVTPENIEFQYALAGPFQRLPAFLFDVLMRFVIYFALLMLIAFVFSWISLGMVATAVSASLLYFGLSWFYGAYMESRYNGRTLGKMLFRLRVISVDGRPINAVQAALRNLLRLADMAVFVSFQTFDPDIPFFAIPTMSFGLVTMMITSRNQRLGDLAAGTMVISEHVHRTPWNLKPDDLRAFGLAELIPASYPISSSLAQTVGMYMENRLRLSPARRMEVAKHLTEPLIRRFDLMPDTSPDLLMCALYTRVFMSTEQQAEGREHLRLLPSSLPRPSLTGGFVRPVPAAVPPSRPPTAVDPAAVAVQSPAIRESDAPVQAILVTRDAVGGDTLSRDAASGDAASRDAASRDAASRDAASRDAVSGDTLSRDAVGGDTVSRDTVTRDAIAGETVVLQPRPGRTIDHG